MKQLVMISTLVMTIFAMPVFGGSLEPSAAPTAGTMKPLSDIEPRIAIHQSDIPLTISTSGSYYLAENVTSTGTCITVAADDVVIDLGGFTITRSGTAANTGITMTGRDNVEIRNGTISNYNCAITENSNSGKNHRILNVRAIGNKYMGFYLLGTNCQVRNCTVSDTGVSASSASIYGILLSNGGVVDNCVITNTGNNTTGGYSVYCLYMSPGSTITRNTIYNNGISASGLVFGLNAGYGCSVSGNMIYNNGTSSYRTYGIYSYNSNTIADNLVYYNGKSATGEVYGIYAYGAGTITNNTVYYNGYLAGGVAVGIYAGGCSTVRGNASYYNGYTAAGSSVCGLLADAGCALIGNSVCRNGVSASGTVYGIFAGSYCLIDNNAAYDNNGTNLYSGAGSVRGNNVAP